MTVDGKDEISFLLKGLSFAHVGAGRLFSLDEARNNNTSIATNGDDWWVTVPFTEN